MAWGLDDPSWEGYTKRTRGKWKREEIAKAEKLIQDYEQRHNLAGGSLLGRVGTGAAPCAPPAQGALAGPAAAPPPPPGSPPPALEDKAQSQAAGSQSSPRDSVYAMVRAYNLRPFEGAAPPPPAGPPPDLESRLFAPDSENSEWGGELLALPSQVLLARPSQVGGPRAAVAKEKEQREAADPHHSEDSMDSSSGESGGAGAAARKYAQFYQRQQELYEQAGV